MQAINAHFETMLQLYALAIEQFNNALLEHFNAVVDVVPTAIMELAPMFLNA